MKSIKTLAQHKPRLSESEREVRSIEDLFVERQGWAFAVFWVLFSDVGLRPLES